MRPRELVEGNCYFHLTYSEQGMLFPSIQTLVYRRVEVHDDGVERWLFEDPPSTAPPGEEDEPEPLPSFYGYTGDQLV